MSKVWRMKKLGDAIAVLGFSIGALLIFHVPNYVPNVNLASAFPYVLISISFYHFIHAYQLPTLKYFRLPELSIPSIAGMMVAIFYAWSSISSDRAISLPWVETITGLIYLFSIGVGEELVSRGFVFGVLRKYGSVAAVIISSVLFGLMHLNLYLGADWDPVTAYWHCLGAAGFGVLVAVVMIVTRSILTSIVLHALYDWTVVFSKETPHKASTEVNKFDPLWQTIKDSFAHVSMDVTIALFLLGILGLTRIKRFPRFMEPILLRLKLIRQEQ